MTDLGQFEMADRADFANLTACLEAANALPGVQHFKQIALTELQLLPGQEALDLGCGYGSDVAEMARRVQPGGRAVGADRSAKMIGEARARFGSVGLPVSFEVSDGGRLHFAEASFDACRAERLLQHVRDPGQIVAELARVTRPGGRVVLIEFDLGGLIIDSPDAATSRQVITEIGDATPNAWAGRQLPRLLTRAAFSEIRVHAELVQPGHPFVERICRPALDRLRDHAGQSAARLDAWASRLRADGATGSFFAAAPVIIASAVRT